MAKRRTPWNPNTADWLVTQRGKRKQDDVVADLQARGVALKRSWLSRIENGEPFSDDLFDAFVDYYGSVPPPYEVPADEPDGDLVAELRDLTQTMARLIDRFDSLASQAIRDGVRDALREAGLDPDAGGSPPSPPAEQQS